MNEPLEPLGQKRRYGWTRLEGIIIGFILAKRLTRTQYQRRLLCIAHGGYYADKLYVFAVHMCNVRPSL
jgi:hypothetical protein